MVISIALLGFGAAGAILTIFKNSLTKNSEKVIPFLLVLSSLISAAAVNLSQIEIFRFDSYTLFVSYSNLWKIGITYLFYLLPFFLMALVIGITFTVHADQIGRLYFANLLGSGAGGLLALFFISNYQPEQLAPLISSIPLLAALPIAKKKNIKLFASLISISIIIIAALLVFPQKFILSEHKSISKALNMPETKIFYEEPSAYGYIQIIQSNSLRHAPGLSLNYMDNVPINNAVFVDGNWFGPLLEKTKFDTTKYFQSVTGHLPFYLKTAPNILILDGGTGRDALHSLNSDTSIITIVEQNRAVIQLLNNQLADEVDSLFNNPKLKVIQLTSRTYLQQSNEKYDLIILPMIDIFGGSIGMFALREQYLFTKESLNKMFDLLTDSGYILINSWLDYPYRNSLKLFSTITEVLEEKGLIPIEHFLTIKNWNALSLLIKNNPFNNEEVSNAKKFAEEMSFDLVLYDGIKEFERDRYNVLQDDKFYDYLDKILYSKEKREVFYNQYLFNIKPATDDKPYFSQFMLWKSFPYIKESFGLYALPFFEVGYLILYLTLLQIFVAVIIFIILPLLKVKFSKGKRVWTILYFSGLGVGYMFLEIILIQKFTLYFGNINYAAAAVMCIMLVSSGLGSLMSGKLSKHIIRWFWVMAFIVVMIIVYSFIMNDLLLMTIGKSILTKIILTIALIAIPSFLMGFPFPVGIKLLKESTEELIPWAWGINASLSVLSAVLAVVIAIEYGFFIVMVIAAAAYLISLFSSIFQYKILKT